MPAGIVTSAAVPGGTLELERAEAPSEMLAQGLAAQLAVEGGIAVAEASQGHVACRGYRRPSQALNARAVRAARDAQDDRVGLGACPC